MKYRIIIQHRAEPLELLNDNVDVEVIVNERDRYFATFFTLSNIERLMNRYMVSGECANGLYFWAKNAIVIRDLEEHSIAKVIKKLLASGEFESAFGLAQDQIEDD